MKACRRDLEATLGLKAKALDAHKELIERRVLSVRPSLSCKLTAQRHQQPGTGWEPGSPGP